MAPEHTRLLINMRRILSVLIKEAVIFRTLVCRGFSDFTTGNSDFEGAFQMT